MVSIFMKDCLAYPELHQLGTIEKIEFFAKERVEKRELRNLRNADDLVKKITN